MNNKIKKITVKDVSQPIEAFYLYGAYTRRGHFIFY